MNRIFLIAALALPTQLFAAPNPTPSSLYRDLAPILAKSNVDRIEICVEGTCERWEILHERTAGKAESSEVPAEGQNAETGIPAQIGQVVGSVLGQVSGTGAHVGVDYKHTKGADGSETTEVKVDVSVGTGSGAAPAASGGNQPTK